MSYNYGLKQYSGEDPFSKLLGYKILKIDRKKLEAKVTLTIQKQHLSLAGRVHGGVVSAFFDHSCGAAVFSTLGKNDFCSTVELKVNYFAPLNTGDKLLSHAKIVFRGNRLCVVHALLYRDNEKKPVAMATGTFNIVSK